MKVIQVMFGVVEIWGDTHLSLVSREAVKLYRKGGYSAMQSNQVLSML